MSSCVFVISRAIAIATVSEGAEHRLKCRDDAVRRFVENNHSCFLLKLANHACSGVRPTRRESNEHELALSKPRGGESSDDSTGAWDRLHPDAGRMGTGDQVGARIGDDRRPGVGDEGNRFAPPAAARSSRVSGSARCARAGSSSASRWSSVEGVVLSGGYLPPLSVKLPAGCGGPGA